MATVPNRPPHRRRCHVALRARRASAVASASTMVGITAVLAIAAPVSRAPSTLAAAGSANSTAAGSSTQAAVPSTPGVASAAAALPSRTANTSTHGS